MNVAESSGQSLGSGTTATTRASCGWPHSMRYLSPSRRSTNGTTAQPGSARAGPVSYTAMKVAMPAMRAMPSHDEGRARTGRTGSSGFVLGAARSEARVGGARRATLDRRSRLRAMTIGAMNGDIALHQPRISVSEVISRNEVMPQSRHSAPETLGSRTKITRPSCSRKVVGWPASGRRHRRRTGRPPGGRQDHGLSDMAEIVGGTGRPQHKANVTTCVRPSLGTGSTLHLTCWNT